MKRINTLLEMEAYLIVLLDAQEKLHIVFTDCSNYAIHKDVHEALFMVTRAIINVRKEVVKFQPSSKT